MSLDESIEPKDKLLLKYQYEQIIKQLMLRQDHAASRACPYSPYGEMCIRKHLMAIEAYAQETIPMEEDVNYADKLGNLNTEAYNYQLDQEQVLCGDKKGFTEGLEQWARKCVKNSRCILSFVNNQRRSSRRSAIGVEPSRPSEVMFEIKVIGGCNVSKYFGAAGLF